MPAPSTGGLLAALRDLGATLGEALGIRGSLFAVELREEIERRKHLVVLAALAGVFLHMALIVFTLLVAIVFWETHRVAAVGAMALLYAALGAGTFLAMRRSAAASPPPFAASLNELAQDLAQMRAPR